MSDIARRPLVRPDVLQLRPGVHGSVSAEELAPFGFRPSEVLDFSVNTNPCGPAPSVLRAVRDTDWSRYPGDDEAPLRAALAHRADVTSEQIALGNGSAELMWLIALATLRPGDRAAVLAPTFGEYARSARAVGATVREVREPGEADGCAILFVCNPNNPTGLYRPQVEIERLLADQVDRLVVLDEAYATFVDECWRSEPLLARNPNLVILRSMTKDQAVPGLRLGYLLAAPELARAVEAVRPPWSVNAGALRAGLAALEPEAQAHVGRAKKLVSHTRRLLRDGFEAVGCHVWPSAANFVLVDVGDGVAFRRALLPRGMVVRDCASFGLPSCVRVACRPTADCERLLRAVEEILGSGVDKPRR